MHQKNQKLQKTKFSEFSMSNLNQKYQKHFSLRVGACLLATCSFVSTTNAQVPSKFRFADLAGQDVIDLPQVESDFPPPAAQSTDKGLGLPDIVALSLQQSPQIRQARAQYESAEARLGMARSDLLPSASLRIAKGPEKSESTSITTDTGKHTYYSRTMRLTQPVFNAPVFKEFDSSRQTKDASSLRFQSMREATSLAATKATIDVATARITLNFSDAQLEQLNKILSYLEARTSAGASSQADLERARTRVLAARQTRLEQQTNYRNAMFELDRLTGAMPTALQLPFLQLLPALPDNYGQIRQYVKEQNFDLLALRKEVNAQRSTVSGEYGKYLPVFGVSLEKDTTENVRGINAPWTDTRALAVMTWNISLGGKEYFSAQ
ncbi:MAG: hypothetical protein RIQ69_2484, partial [Pseudomonadota bacterium]